jgi:GABA(A) receptor-associated protein
MEFKFKKDTPDLLQRRNECDKIRKQFPDKIPIICEKDPKSKIQEIDKTKYLVPSDLTVAQFCNMLKSRITIGEKEAFFLLFNGAHQVGLDTLMQEAYEKYKNPDDGFLYIMYSSELVWGKNQQL